MNNKERKNKGKRKIFKILLIVFFILLFTTVGVLGAGVVYVKKTIDKVEKVEIKQEELSITPEVEEIFGEIRNIALFGIDAPKGQNGRSDAIMVLTLDTVHNKMKLTSIMRDSYVNIPAYGMDKINHAYSFGGPELAIKTLNENFDLNIKEFMSVNFTSLPAIIDKIGGININITSEEFSHIPGLKSTGNQNLNGEQALAYSRIRYASGGDYKRTERQRTIVNAVFEKLKSTSVAQYPSLINDFLPYVTTNMDSNQLLNLSTNFASILISGITMDRFPRDGQGQGKTINGVYYLTFDRNTVRNSIHDYIFDDN